MYHRYHINQLQFFISMERVKASTSPGVFSTYFQPINDVYEARFYKHSFKEPDVFDRILPTVLKQNK